MKLTKKAKSKRDLFFETVKNDKSIDWDFRIASKRTLALDILYLLGYTLDEKKYVCADGFKEFLKDCEITI